MGSRKSPGKRDKNTERRKKVKMVRLESGSSGRCEEQIVFGK